MDISGLVKVRLVHALGASLLVPDQIYMPEPPVWFQPRRYFASTVMKTKERIQATLWCDVETAQGLRIDVNNDQAPQQLTDHSWLYACILHAPADIRAAATGTWKYGLNGELLLRLFHHTTHNARTGILSSGEFWSSTWNIQGNKKLSNIGYVYFTSLESIKTHRDLAAIAMSPNRVLHLDRDGSVIPNPVPPNWKETDLARDILEVQVYWSAPERRNAVVEVHVPATLLAPGHVWRHSEGPVTVYEVSHPAIFRVGIEPGRTLPIAGDGTIVRPPGFKQFAYMVIGDARTLDGLRAPYDEENTTHTFRIQDGNTPPLEFWFENANKPIYDKLSAHVQEFDPTSYPR